MGIYWVVYMGVQIGTLMPHPSTDIKHYFKLEFSVLQKLGIKQMSVLYVLVMQ